MGTEELSIGNSETKKFWAFISYSSKDQRWGRWLHSSLENYTIPEEFRKVKVIDGEPLGKNLRPVFRDRDELSGSAELGPALEKALRNSRFLIVLCSKNSAQSEWVNKEIEDFRSKGGEKRILALILDGVPNATSNNNIDDSEECFPPALRYPLEPLAGDLRKEGDGKERGFLKILAGITQLDFDTLYRRHERAQKKKRVALMTIAALIIFMLSALSLYALNQKKLAEEQREIAVEQKGIAVEQKGIAEKKTLEVIEEKREVERQKGFAEEQKKLAEEQREVAVEQKGIAEKKTEEALISLSKNYLMRGKQAFLDGRNAESLLFIDNAQKTWPPLLGFKMIQADNWFQLKNQLGIFNGQGEEVQRMYFSRDSQQLLIQDQKAVRKFDLPNKKEHMLAQSYSGLGDANMVSKAPFFCRFQKTTSQDNTDYLQFTLELFDWQKGKVIKSIPWTEREPDFIELSRSGKMALLGTGRFGNDKFTLKAVDFRSSEKRNIKISDTPGNFKWSFANEDQILVGIKYTGNKYWLDFYNISSGEKVKTIDLKQFPSAFTNHGKKFWLGFHSGEILEFSFNNDKIAQKSYEKVITQAVVLQYNESKDILMASGAFGRIALYNCNEGTLKWKTGNDRLKGVVRYACLSSSGRLVAAVHNNNVSVFDLDKNKLLLRHQWKGTEGSCVAISDDDKQLAFADVSGIVRVWALKKQADSIHKIKVEGENQIIRMDAVSDDEYLLHCRKVYKYNYKTSELEEVYENSALQYQLSHRNNLISQSPWNNVEVKNNKSTDKISSRQAVNRFLKSGKTIAGVIFEKDGIIRPYSSKPEFIAGDYKSKKINGKVFSAVISEDCTSLCASYTDGHILFASIDSRGIKKVKEILLPAASKFSPIILSCTPSEILLKLKSRFILINTKESDKNIYLPAEIKGVTLFIQNGQTIILSQDSYGQVKKWNTKGLLLNKAKSPVYQSKERISTGSGKNLPGNNILISSDGNKICTSFGPHIFIWSINDLQLLWRSPVLIPLNSFGSVKVQPLFWQKSSILIGKPSYNPQTWEKILQLKLPSETPSSDQVKEFIKNKAGISMKDGQIIDL